MTEPTITTLPPAPLYAMEIWSNVRDVAARFDTALAVALPAMGRWTAGTGLTLYRVEPAVWLIEGDVSPLGTLLGKDGALTAIGGGIVRVRIAGEGWRALLMENGLFDAESAAFAAGCCAATIIDHVAVRLFVASDGEACCAYVPASYADGVIRFWAEALPRLSLTRR